MRVRAPASWSLRLALSVVLASPALPGCAAATSRFKSGLTGQQGTMSMPNLFRMSKAKALTTLKLAGHEGSVAWDDQLCGSVVDGQIIELGEICRQRPEPGTEVSTRVPVALLAQPEDPRHGKVGQTGEWHLMPSVVGMSLDEAQAAMRAAGFTDERTRVDEVSEAGCKPKRVCRSYPEALNRIGQQSDRVLAVGVDPSAQPKPPVRPAPEVATPPAPKPDEPPPPPKPPESYF